VVTSTLVFEGGGEVNEYVGGYSDWLRQRKVGSPPKARSRTATPNVAAASGAPAAPGSATPGSSAAPVLAVPGPEQSKPRRLSYNEQRELAAMPEKIHRLEAEQLELQAAIADPALFQGNDQRGAAALQRLQSLAAELESAYARWEALDA